MKQRSNNEMNTQQSNVSLTVYHSGVKTGDRELVIACGYSVGGKFGYFITHEEPMAIGFEYSNTISFHPKENERTYAKVLTQLKELIEKQ